MRGSSVVRYRCFNPGNHYQFLFKSLEGIDYIKVWGMGLKHGKYIYVEREDGFYVKVRLLKIRFGKKGKEAGDLNNPENYVVTLVKTRNPPPSAMVIKEQDLPDEVRRRVGEV